jgi:hypothetical protein
MPAHCFEESRSAPRSIDKRGAIEAFRTLTTLVDLLPQRVIMAN